MPSLSSPPSTAFLSAKRAARNLADLAFAVLLAAEACVLIGLATLI